MTEGRDDLSRIFRRMGEPSWYILRGLVGDSALPAFEIADRVEHHLRAIGHPYPRLDPSTLHYALRRMQEDDLVRKAGTRPVEVPGPRGAVRLEERAVYELTGLGSRVLREKDRIETASRRLRSGQPSSRPESAS